MHYTGGYTLNTIHYGPVLLEKSNTWYHNILHIFIIVQWNKSTDLRTSALPYIFSMARQPLVGQGLPHFRGLTISLTDTPHSVGLLWTSDRPVADTSTWQRTTRTSDRHPRPGEIWTRNPSKRVAADPCLRPRGHWDRLRALYSRSKTYHC